MAEIAIITDAEFKSIRDLVYANFGINLTEQKRALVVGRLNKVLREQGFTSFQEYYDHVTGDKSGKALTTLVDRISTNHTFFFRENDHFEYFAENALPEWLDTLEAASTRRIHLWVAGCSSGEESYTLAMLFREALGSQINKWQIGILATDISSVALEKAVKGVYSEENVTHMPPGLKNKYFEKLPDKQYKVVDSVRKMVLHRKLNLMRPSFPFKSTFQFIFCRNVMIYFDRPTRDTLVSKFYKFMEPSGYLFIGHSETLGRSNEQFQYIRPALYRKV